MKRVFRLPSTKNRIDEDVDAELAFHLEGRVEDIMMRESLSREEAEREARRRFGDYRTYRDQARDIDSATRQRRNRREFFEMLEREIRHAGRALLRTPSFSAVAIVTLALGLGAATTIFTLLDRVVIRPLPYPNADRLVHLGTLWPKVKAGEEYSLSKGQYFYFKKNSTSLADLLMYDTDILVVPGDADHPSERVSELDVSASTFRLLAIAPERGRLFTEADEQSMDGDPKYALISDAYWRRRFGADEHILGKRIPYGANSVEIIGVLPADASIVGTTAEVWIRNRLIPTEPPYNNHTHHAIGLLRPGVTAAAAAAEIQNVQNAMMARYPNVYPARFLARTGFAMHVTSLRDAVVGQNIVRALWLLFAGVAFVLLIAAANVANLFLVRIDARRREVAVRTALGASRMDLAIHYLAESVLLSSMSAIAAIALGYGLLRVVLHVAPQSLPRLQEVHVDASGVAFCAVAALAFGVVFGLLPLWNARLDVNALRDGGRGLTFSRPRELTRRALVLVQVALAVVLLSGGALMAKSFTRLREVDPGFKPAGVQTMMVLLTSARTQSGAATVELWHNLISRLETTPGIVRAGAAESLPLEGGSGCSAVLPESPEVDEGSTCMPMQIVTPGYFEAMGIAVRGATPTWSAVVDSTGPMIVTAAFARRFWKSRDAIGLSVAPFNGRMGQYPIVGVARDVRANGLQNPPIEEAYFPMLPPRSAQNLQGWPTPSAAYLAVRAPSLSGSAVARDVRAILAQLDPRAPIADLRSMDEIVAKSTAQTSFMMLLLLISATIALALSAVGIFGVVAFAVGQRRAEIGIRVALGASAGAVTRLVVGQTAGIAVAGAVIGVVAALFSTRVMSSLLFNVSPTDPVMLGAAAFTLLVVALLASVGPARRAAKIDPVEAMRAT